MACPSYHQYNIMMSIHHYIEHSNNYKAGYYYTRAKILIRSFVLKSMKKYCQELNFEIAEKFLSGLVWSLVLKWVKNSCQKFGFEVNNYSTYAPHSTPFQCTYWTFHWIVWKTFPWRFMQLRLQFTSGEWNWAKTFRLCRIFSAIDKNFPKIVIFQKISSCISQFAWFPG